MTPDPETPPRDAQPPGRQHPRRGFVAGVWTVATSTLLSRILGMFRDTVTARLFGVSPVSDAFWLAFKIPNLARRLFGEGALTAAFLPAFAKELAECQEAGKPPHSAWELASAVMTLLAIVLLAIVLAAEALLWGLSIWLAEDAALQLLLGLTAVMLPYALLICLAAQVTATLHALGHFTWPALVPVVLNVCWLLSIWLVDPWFEPDRVAQAYALAVCVVVAGVLQFGMQWPVLLRLGFRFGCRVRESWPAVREVVRSMLPVMFGLSVEQINTLLDGVIAWAFSDPGDGSRMSLPGSPAFPLQVGAVSALYFGERLYQFPVGVFGVTLGTVLFPLFARHAARGEIDHLREDLSLGLRLVIAICIPASVGLMLTSEPLTRVLLEHGEFTADDGRRTAALIAAYGSGVWAVCSLPILYRAFYALGDRTAPVRVGLWAVLFDLVLNLTSIWPLAERGLAYSTALSAAAQATCLVWLLQRRTGRLDWSRLTTTLLKTLLATAAMSVTYWISARWFPTTGSTSLLIAGLLVPILIAILGYLVASHLVGLREPWVLLRRDGVSNREPGG